MATKLKKLLEKLPNAVKITKIFHDEKDKRCTVTFPKGSIWETDFDEVEKYINYYGCPLPKYDGKKCLLVEIWYTASGKFSQWDAARISSRVFFYKGTFSYYYRLETESVPIYTKRNSSSSGWRDEADCRGLSR